MFLLLAPPGDIVAARFSLFLQERREPHFLSKSLSGAHLSVSVAADGTTRVEIRDCDTGKLVRGVLNRGIPIQPQEARSPSFNLSEQIASWWSALACFPGPVLNRPTRAGLFPSLYPPSICSKIPEFLPGRLRIKTRPPSVKADLATNIHRVRDGWFIGRLAGTTPDEIDAHLYTSFEPLRTLRLLMAGRTLFCLNSMDGMPPAQLGSLNTTLQSELCARQATFALLVLELEGSRFRILHATPFPQPHHFAHLEGRVYEAILEYLSDENANPLPWTCG